MKIVEIQVDLFKRTLFASRGRKSLAARGEIKCIRRTLCFAKKEKRRRKRENGTYGRNGTKMWNIAGQIRLQSPFSRFHRRRCYPLLGGFLSKAGADRKICKANIWISVDA